jgi:hypothetical protein
MDFWADGNTHQHSTDSGAECDRRFGSRVVHSMTEKNGKYAIGGFIMCLRWYIAAWLAMHSRAEERVRYYLYGGDYLYGSDRVEAS